MILLPSIDLRGGRCVRLLRGNFDEETVYEIDLVDYIGRLRNLGARMVHVVDLDGAKGDGENRTTVIELASKTGVSLQVGGGIRSRDDVRSLLSAGIARVAVGSAAVDNRGEVASWITEFGSDRVTLALDVKIVNGTPLLQTHGWLRNSSASLWDLLDFYRAVGACHILCTDIDQDGSLHGPNLELYRQCIDWHGWAKWQASGGVRATEDLEALEGVGVHAAIAGTALLHGKLTDDEISRWVGA